MVAMMHRRTMLIRSQSILNRYGGILIRCDNEGDVEYFSCTKIVESYIIISG